MEAVTVLFRDVDIPWVLHSRDTLVHHKGAAWGRGSTSSSWRGSALSHECVTRVHTYTTWERFQQRLNQAIKNPPRPAGVLQVLWNDRCEGLILFGDTCHPWFGIPTHPHLVARKKPVVTVYTLAQRPV